MTTLLLVLVMVVHLDACLVNDDGKFSENNIIKMPDALIYGVDNQMHLLNI